jgi:hypothetical protein
MSPGNYGVFQLLKEVALGGILALLRLSTIISNRNAKT